jgi:hypothetical protein
MLVQRSIQPKKHWGGQGGLLQELRSPDAALHNMIPHTCRLCAAFPAFPLVARSESATLALYTTSPDCALFASCGLCSRSIVENDAIAAGAAYFYNPVMAEKAASEGIPIPGGLRAWTN